MIDTTISLGQIPIQQHKRKEQITENIFCTLHFFEALKVKLPPIRSFKYRFELVKNAFSILHFHSTYEADF